MIKITNQLLEQLIDCQEDEVPSALVIQRMASEIMRLRSYGEMVPAPDEDIKQRSIILLRNIKNDPQVENTFKRLAALLQDKVGIDSYATIVSGLNYIVGDTPLSEDSDWIEIESELLLECEKVIHDALGFGASHSHESHNSSLNTLRKYIENAHDAYTTLVPRTFVEKMRHAISEIVYGKIYPMSTREALIQKLSELLPEEMPHE